MLDNEFLTQDIDILPDVWLTPTEVDAWTDILPDAPATEELPVKSTEWDSELDALLAWVNESSEVVSENIEEASSAIAEVKDKVEEVQANPENSDDTLKEIYQDLLQTETALQATEIAKDVALSKVSELQAQVSELEINAAGQYTTDNPDLMIVNKLLNAAAGWSDVATPKVKDALNKIYLSLFNTSIEDGQIQDNLEWVDNSWLTLNEGTTPVGSIPEVQEEVDIDDITSILW